MINGNGIIYIIICSTRKNKQTEHRRPNNRLFSFVFRFAFDFQQKYSNIVYMKSPKAENTHFFLERSVNGICQHFKLFFLQLKFNLASDLNSDKNCLKTNWTRILKNFCSYLCDHSLKAIAQGHDGPAVETAYRQYTDSIPAYKATIYVTLPCYLPLYDFGRNFITS